MTANTISEADFLLTELRYTLGQLHVQVLDLDEHTRQTAAYSGRTIDKILSDMIQTEKECQANYTHLLKMSIPAGAAEQAIPLPVGGKEQEGQENSFEHARTQTIALLEQAGNNWSPELLDAVKQQVRNDRKSATDIAECRKQFFERDQRPDLNEPLTAAP